jgi:hypothetical protein
MSELSTTSSSHDASFLIWLKSNGASFPKIVFPSVHPTLGYRCTLTTEEIMPDEPMVAIPYKLMICAPNCLRTGTDPLCVTLKSLWKNRSLVGDPLLCICICREVLLGPSSSFEPYISFLRNSEPPGTIQRWTAAEVAELQNEALATRIQTRINDEARMHSRALATISDHAVSLSQDVSAVLPLLTLELFTWAWHNIQARAFGRRLPWSALVPMADCLNHANLPVRYRLDSIDGGGKVGGAVGSTTDPLDSEDNAALLSPVGLPSPGGTFTLYPSGNNRYPPNTEAFNSYGRRTNDNLMLDYGFCLENNEWEKVSCRLSVSPTDASYKRTKDALAMNGFSSVKTLKLGWSLFPTEGMVFFRVVNMSGEEIEAASGEWKTPPGSRFVNLPNELRALSGLLGVMRALNVREWTTTVQEDEELLATTPSGSRLFSAVRYRLERKRIVQENVMLADEAFQIVCKLSGEEITPDQSREIVAGLLDAAGKSSNKRWREYLRDLARGNSE